MLSNIWREYIFVPSMLSRKFRYIWWVNSKVFGMIPTHQRLTQPMANLSFWERKLKFRLAKFRPRQQESHHFATPLPQPTSQALECSYRFGLETYCYCFSMWQYSQGSTERIRKITIPTVKLVHLRKVKVRNITY